MQAQISLGSFITNFFLLFGVSGVSFAYIGQFAANLWLIVTVLAYIVSLAGLVLIVYTMIRLYEVRKREEEYYGTLLLAPDTVGPSPRWRHIEALVGSANPAEWRQAIIEADIMLDDMLSRRGYTGEGVGEKLRQADHASFATLRDAQEAHGVRNRVAHQGSAYDLSDTLARRTIARYEAVFREFGVL